MSESPQPSQDAQHLQLLAIFHYVCAGIIALFACFPIIHLFMGLAMVFSPRTFTPPNSGPQPPFEVVGWIFIFFAGAFMLFGWTFAALVAWAGRCLSRRVRYTFCLVMGAIVCVFMPFGTVLGVFTVIVLMRPTVKPLFAPVVNS